MSGRKTISISIRDMKKYEHIKNHPDGASNYINYLVDKDMSETKTPGEMNQSTLEEINETTKGILNVLQDYLK
ncbi:MAG: hypothetical protein FWF59_05305 [Turicibacter sp.]|nr:hypothetical protein [Turicibacter sp.]